jgi:WD40 repeat protein
VARPDALAGWLYGTARRIALRVRSSRRHLIADPASLPAPTRDPLADVSARELLEILEAELARLPEPLRLPLVLCAIEGQTVEDAARRLGATPSAIKGRLERGRARLHSRLTKRGFTLPAALAVALAVTRTGVATTLVDATVRVAMGSDVPTAVAALVVTGGGRWKLVCAAALLVAAAGLGVAVMPQKKPLPAVPNEPAKPQAVLPDGAIARLGTLQMRGCRGPILFSPNGKYLFGVTGTAATEVTCWDAATGRVVRTFPVSATIRNLAVSPDGTLLACADASLASPVWDVETGKTLFATPAVAVAFTADNRLISASAAGNERVAVRTYDKNWLKTAERELPGDPYEGVGLSPDGRAAAVVISGRKLNVVLFDLKAGNETKAFHAGGERVAHLAFSPDGATLAAGAFDGVHLWDVASGKLRRHWPQRGGAGPTFSADGKTVAWTGFWNGPGGAWVAAVTDDAPHTVGGATNYLYAAPAVSPDGKTAAVVTDGGAVILRRVDTGADVLPPGGNSGRVGEVMFTPDRRHLLSRSIAQTVVWDLATRKLMRRFPEDLPDGERAVAATLSAGRVVTYRPADATVRLRDLVSLKEIRRLETNLGPYDAKYGELYRNGAVTPDGRVAVLEGLNNRVFVLDLETGKRRCEYPLAGHALRYHLSADGNILAITREGIDQTLFLDARTGKEVGPNRWPGGWTEPGGHWPEWFDRAEARLKKRLPDFQGPGVVLNVYESPRGHTLAVRGRTGKSNEIREDAVLSLRLYDTRTGRALPRFDPTPMAQEVALFSPDGRLFVTTAMDGSVHVWEIATGRERARFAGHIPGEVTSLAFSSDGRTLVSGGADTQVFLWDMTGRSPNGTWRTVKHSPERQRELWAVLVGDDAKAAHRAIWELAADPAGTAAWISQHLRPILAPDREVVNRHIEQLGAERFSDRERAAAALRELGEPVIPSLRDALKRATSAEQRRRLEALLREWDESAPTGERLRRLRAAEVLERIAAR